MPWPFTLLNPLTINVTNVTTTILNANTHREYALMQNISNVDVFLGLGANAVVNTGIKLFADGGSFEITRLEGNLYQGAIMGIHNSSGAKLVLGFEGGI